MLKVDLKYTFIYHKNICISVFKSQGIYVTTNIETKVAFISRIFMVMEKPEMDYGNCSFH